jgi:indoleamine 2,3-dioxygenase
MQSLPPDHFLARAAAPPAGSAGAAFDTATLAAHDFDVDARTGFMPPQPPLARLPVAWAPWEDALATACAAPLQLATKPDLTTAEAATSAAWRQQLSNVCRSLALSVDQALTVP